MPRKTWVIPTGQNTHRNGGRGAWTRPHLPRNRFANGHERSLPTPTQRRSDLPTALRPGRTLSLAYFMGPLGPWVSQAGRDNRFWLLTGAASTAIGLLTFWQGHDMSWRLQHGSGYGVLWLVLWAVSCIGMCAAWSQGIAMAGQEVAGGMNRLPKRVGNPWVIGFLGALFPGFGLLLSGYPRRAAGAILTYCALCLGGLVLANARDIWKWNKLSHYGGFPVPMLEIVYLVALGLTLVGIVGWLVQMLDGVRLAQRKASSGSDHGDVFAFALVAAMAVFAMVVEPPAFAAEFDHLAEWGQAKGFRITPMALATLAMHLDPSRPDYAMRVADLDEAMGHKRAAKAIRAELHSDWAIYRSIALPVTRKPVTVAGANPLASPPISPLSAGAGEAPKPAVAPEQITMGPVPAGPEPVTTGSVPAGAAQVTASPVPAGAELPPSTVAQEVAAPPSPVKITAAAPATTVKSTTAVTKTTTTKTTAAAPKTTTTKTTAAVPKSTKATTRKSTTVHRSAPTTKSP